MKQKVLIIAHDAFNEYDHPRIAVVSWTTGEVIQNIHIPLSHLQFQKWHVHSEVVETKEFCEVKDFNTPAILTGAEEKRLNRKVMDMSMNMYGDYQSIKIMYARCEERLDESRKKVVGRFTRVYTDDEWTKVASFWEKIDKEIREEKSQDMIIVAPKREEYTYDNGEQWFKDLNNKPLEKLYRKWYAQESTPSRDECVKSYIKELCPEYQIINIVFV